MTQLKVDELTPHERAVLGVMYHQRDTLLRISRQLFNHSNLVDEWSSSGDPTDGVITLIPDYDMEVQITTITASLPVGIKSATLTLGQRTIVLLNQAANTTTQTLVNLQDVGIILNRSDRRTLTIDPGATTGYYLGLSGYALERSGDR